MKKAFFIIATIAILALVGSFYYFGGPYESLVTRLVLAVIGAPFITALIVILMFIPGSREKQMSDDELRREAAYQAHRNKRGRENYHDRFLYDPEEEKEERRRQRNRYPYAD